MRIKTILLTIVLLIVMSMMLAACGSKTKATDSQPPAAKETVAPPATGGSDGEALMNDRCTKCHNLNRVKSAKNTADGWNRVVSNMVSKGAKLTSEEQQILVDYLAKTYAP
jgi:cytochrome c5